jgi:hypothetical protein
MAKADAKSKATYRSNFANPAARTWPEGKSVLDVARMDVEVKALLNKTLGSCSDDYRSTSAASSPAPFTSASGEASSPRTRCPASS